MGQRIGGGGVTHPPQLLGEDRLADALLEGDVLRDLGLEQGLPPAAFGEIDREHRVVGTDRHLTTDLLLPVGPAVERQLDRHGVGRHLAVGPVDEDPVGAGEGLASDVALPLRGVRRIGGEIGVGQKRSTRRRSRHRQRADRAGRLLDHHVDVGVTVPGKLDLDVAHEGLVDGSAEGLGVVHLSLLFKAGDRRLGQPGGTGRHILLTSRPLVGEHAGAGPLEGLEIVLLRGDRHGQRERLAVGRLDCRHLTAQPDRLPRRAEAGQALREREEIVGGCREVGTRHQHPFDLGLRLARRLHCDGEGLIHPRLRLAAVHRRRDQLGSPIEAAGIAELDGRNPQAGELAGAGPGGNLIPLR